MFYNPYLIIPLATWAIAQTFKFSLAALRGNVDFKYFYASGGMPSVHAAVVTSLATTAMLIDGPESSVFGLAATLAAIVMYDSFGVRRSSGEQALALNMLIESLESDRIRLRDPKLKLREILGHKPLEVLMGAFLGVILAGLFNLNKISAQLDWLSARPLRIEMVAYAAIFALLVLGGLVQKIYIRRRHKRSLVLKSLSNHLALMAEAVGVSGLVLAGGQYEKLNILQWRIWSLLILLALAVWAYSIFSKFNRLVPESLAAEREHERRMKWINWRPGQGRKESKKRKK